MNVDVITPQMNEADKRNSHTTLPATISVLVGMAGILLNVTTPHVSPSDSVVGVLVIASIVMMATGYLPMLKGWPGRKLATLLMNVALLCFLLYGAVMIGES